MILQRCFRLEGGRWSDECHRFLCQLAKAKTRNEPKIMRSRAKQPRFHRCGIHAALLAHSHCPFWNGGEWTPSTDDVVCGHVLQLLCEVLVSGRGACSDFDCFPLGFVHGLLPRAPPLSLLCPFYSRPLSLSLLPNVSMMCTQGMMSFAKKMLFLIFGIFASVGR